MPKKPVNATVDELNQAKAELQAAIEELGAVSATKTECQEASVRFEPKVSELTEVVAKNATVADEAVQRVAADAKAHTDLATAEVRTEARRLAQEAEQMRLRGEAELAASVNKVDVDLRGAFADELTSLCETIDKQLADLNQELVARIELQAAQASDALARQRGELDAVIAEAQQSSAACDAEIRAETVAEFRRVEEEWARAQKEQDLQAKQTKEDLQARLDALDALVVEHQGISSTAFLDLRRDASASLEEVREATERHLAELDSSTAELDAALSEVRNGPTRRVEWLIRGASRALATLSTPSGQPHTAWFSPRFDAAGTTGLQLELRLLGTEGSGDKAGTGDCALFLWANKGLHIAFRLYIGDRWTTLEKAYSERMAHGTKRLCFLKDQICAEDDTLHVGVEILEMIREIDTPAPMASGRSELGDGDADSPKQMGANPFEASIISHRHVNNRVLQQARKEVERMQSRMVKRIEWLLEQASALTQHFQPRQPICSPVFSAAGVEGMQLLFYPSGYAGATDGFCSLFLYCPAGVTLRCALSAGKQKREVSHTFEEAGAFGRTNFCRFDGLPDEDTDTLLLVLEVEDCRQELTTAVGEASAVQSEVKLMRMPGKTALQDIKVLPALWTTQALGDMTKPPQGYSSFSALGGGRAKPRTGAGANGGCSGGPAAVASLTSVVGEPEERGHTSGAASAVSAPEARRSGSMPALHSPAARVPSPGDDHWSGGGDSLPYLYKTQGSDWGSKSSSRTRKPRSLRRPAVLAAPPLHAAVPS